MGEVSPGAQVDRLANADLRAGPRYVDRLLSTTSVRDLLKGGAAPDRRQPAAVMGMQSVQDVTLIRHAYVATSRQWQGIEVSLLSHLQTLAKTPILISIWAHAHWAIRFYEKHRFRLVGARAKGRAAAALLEAFPHGRWKSRSFLPMKLGTT